MGIGITSNLIASLQLVLSNRFQSPMGIGITSNYKRGPLSPPLANRFQSPMGIGITSNYFDEGEWRKAEDEVSIPNGDRHYLELQGSCWRQTPRHQFQSPMGIGITSNYQRCTGATASDPLRFQSPMGIGITSNYGSGQSLRWQTFCFNPQWG